MFRLQRETTGKDAQRLPLYMEKIVAAVFANISTSDRPAWEKNIESATKVAALIAASAKRLGFHNKKIIKNIVCGFILFDFEQEQLVTQRIYFSFKTFRVADENIQRFKKSIQRTLARMHAAKVDRLLEHFFNEPTVKMRERMFMFWYKLPPLPSASLAYLRDWVLLEDFFNTPSRVMPYIDQLESDLQMYVAMRPDEALFGMDCVKRYTLPMFTSKRYKVLSGFFNQWAESNGFMQTAKILAPLKTARFLRLLVELSLIKDSGVEDDKHGVWSHAVQLYAFVEYAKDNKEFLHSALQIIQSLGGGTLAATEKFPSTLWNYIFDDQSGDNFSSPEYIKTLLWYRFIPRWPLLSESVWRADQAAKRDYEVSYTAYLQEKHIDEVDEAVVIRQFK